MRNHFAKFFFYIFGRDDGVVVGEKVVYCDSGVESNAGLDDGRAVVFVVVAGA